jgi:hypothetical protein
MLTTMLPLTHQTQDQDYMVLLSLVAAWRVLHFKPTVALRDKAEEGQSMQNGAPTNEAPALVREHEALHSDSNVSATISGQRTTLGADKLSSMLASEGALRMVAFIAAAACTLTVVLHAKDWTKSNSTMEMAMLFALFIMPSIAGSFCFMLGWMWAGCSAFAVIAFLCFSIVVFDPSDVENSLVFALAMTCVAIAAPFFSIGIRRNNGATKGRRGRP